MNVPKVIEKKDEVTDEVNSKEKHELVKSKVVIPEVNTQHTEVGVNLNFQAHPYGLAFLNP